MLKSESKKKEYKITIVIPVYNVEQYITKCLHSALNQTFHDIEYLLIDDHGLDKSMELARALVNSHSRKDDIRIIDHGRNIGAGATRNTGLMHAKGEYIFFMDSDDELAMDAIEKLYKPTKKNQVDIVVGSYKSVDRGKTGQKWEWLFENNIIKGKNFEVAEFYLRGGFYVMPWNKLYKIDFLRKNKIYCIANNIHEDVFFTIQAALNAMSIALIPDVTYYYTFREGSTMSIYKEKNFMDYSATIDHLVNYSVKYSNTNIYPRLIYYIYGFRYSIMKQLSKSDTVSNQFKTEYLKKLSVRFLKFYEIWKLPETKTIHKIKYSISAFSHKNQLFMIDLIEKIYKAKQTSRYK